MLLNNVLVALQVFEVAHDSCDIARKVLFRQGGQARLASWIAIFLLLGPSNIVVFLLLGRRTDVACLQVLGFLLDSFEVLEFVEAEGVAARDLVGMTSHLQVQALVVCIEYIAKHSSITSIFFGDQLSVPFAVLEPFRLQGCLLLLAFSDDERIQVGIAEYCVIDLLAPGFVVDRARLARDGIDRLQRYLRVQ